MEIKIVYIFLFFIVHQIIKLENGQNKCQNDMQKIIITKNAYNLLQIYHKILL